MAAVMDVNTWKSRSALTLRSRSDDLKAVDRALEDYWQVGGWGHHQHLKALRESIEAWIKTKGRKPDGAIDSDRAGAVEELLGQVERALLRRDIYVALWSFSNQHGSTLPISRKLEYVGAILQGLKSKIMSADLDPSQDLKGIFVAPEYFHAAPNAGEHRSAGGFVKRTVPAYDKMQFVHQLEGISNAAKGILIVPGSVAWSELLDRAKVEESIKQLEDPQKYKNIGPKVMDNQGPLVTDVIPNWSQKKDFVRKPGSGPKYVMHNTAFAFLDGRPRYEYHKHGDFHEAVGSPNLVFIPGHESGVKTIGGITMGFEICLDHAIGYLASRTGKHPVGLSGAQARPVVERELHIVASDSVANSPKHMALWDGGYFLHASTDPGCTKVYHRTGAHVMEVMPVEEVAAGPANEPLRFYRISIARKEAKSPARKYVPDAYR